MDATGRCVRVYWHLDHWPYQLRITDPTVKPTCNQHRQACRCNLIPSRVALHAAERPLISPAS